MEYAPYIAAIAALSIGLFLYHKRKIRKRLDDTNTQDGTVTHCIRFGGKDPEQSIEDIACIYRVKRRE